MSVRRLVSEDCAEPVTLADGIQRLERGGPCQGLQVDLGNGNLACADGRFGRAGLLQRLIGHRLILAFAADPAPEGVTLPPRPIDVSEETREILDLVRPIS
ncbi:MAG: hypothetical protein AAGJ29_05460 [Pseudomonadota bacterium]